MSRRLLVSAALAAVGVLALAAPAGAEPAPSTLISFTDTDPSANTIFGITTTVVGAAGWIQSVAATNVSIDALLARTAETATGNWWLTNQLDLGTTSANVVASGSFTTTLIDSVSDLNDFNPLPRVTLATGLNLAPGIYYLVLQGPASEAFWGGGQSSGVATHLDPGFDLFDYFESSAAVPFAPASRYFPVSGFSFDFDVTGVPHPTGAPEPAAWTLMIGGFALAGASLRRGRRATA